MLNISRLQELISSGKELEKDHIKQNDIRFTSWKLSVEKFLSDEFGSDSIEMKHYHEVPLDEWHYTLHQEAGSPIAQYIVILQNCLDDSKRSDNGKMSLFTERHGMRKPVEKTSEISVDAYALLFDICSNHFQYLAWKYPDECPDGSVCCGIDLEKLNIDLKYTIPSLFRYEGQITKPRRIKNVFDPEPHVDEYDQYALLDLIDFIAQNIRDIKSKTYHSYYKHYDMVFGTTNEIAKTFVESINDTFDKTGLLYHLTDDLKVERIEEAGVLSESIEKNIQAIKEPGIKDLLTIAIQKHRSPDPNDQKDAVEKLWDAFERLKTYYTTLKKTDSANKIIGNMANSQPDYITLFTEEFRKLTDIGNDFRIRHHETNRIDITDIRYYDYFFNRCLSLIATAIQYLQ